MSESPPSARLKGLNARAHSPRNHERVKQPESPPPPARMKGQMPSPPPPLRMKGSNNPSPSPRTHDGSKALPPSPPT